MQQTVFVVDDDYAARDSLTFLMRTEGLTSRAFDSARSFLDQLHKEQRGCIVLDAQMPMMNGMALVESLNEAGCIMPMILTTGHADVPLALQAMKAGVVDFIEKPFDSETILRAVGQALATEQTRHAAASRLAAVERRRETLTQRESQVLGFIVDGFSNKEIANKLEISFRTVEIYRANVMAKMEAESLSALVRMTLYKAAA